MIRNFSCSFQIELSVRRESVFWGACNQGSEFASTNRAVYAAGKLRTRRWRPAHHAARASPTNLPLRTTTSKRKAVWEILEICRNMTTIALIFCELRHLVMWTGNY